jgi:hypothetical protein
MNIKPFFNLDIEIFQRLFFACKRKLNIIKKASEKAAPPDVSNSTKQDLRPFISIPVNDFTIVGVVVRGADKQRSICLSLNFWFFWFKPKEHKRKKE